MFGFRNSDLHSYALKRRELREDFEKAKHAKTEEELDNLQEKYEFFMEQTYNMNPLTCKIRPLIN
jgi:hypothetical protein